MPISCTACGVEIPDNAGFCPSCGRPVAGSPPVLGTTGGLNDKLAGMLAYVTFIPAIVFLLIEPFKKNRFIRFHAFQCLFLWAALVVLSVVLRLAFFVLFLIPILGHLLWLVVWLVLSVGCFILWVVLLVKAFQGEMFKLPVIGDWAERQANLV
jgi:uncharacterized membrane protein